MQMIPIPFIKWGSRVRSQEDGLRARMQREGAMVEFAERSTDYLTDGPLNADCRLTVQLRRAYYRTPNRWDELLDTYEKLIVQSPEAIICSDQSLPDCLGTLFIVNALHQRGVDLTRCRLYLCRAADDDPSPGVFVDLGPMIPRLTDLWAVVCTRPPDLLGLQTTAAGPDADRWLALLTRLIYLMPDERGIDAVDELILTRLRGKALTVADLVSRVTHHLDSVGAVADQHLHARILALSEHNWLLAGSLPEWRSPPIRLGPLESADLAAVAPSLTQVGRRILGGASRVDAVYRAWRWIGGWRASDF